MRADMLGLHNEFLVHALRSESKNRVNVQVPTYKNDSKQTRAGRGCDATVWLEVCPAVLLSAGQGKNDVCRPWFPTIIFR